MGEGRRAMAGGALGASSARDPGVSWSWYLKYTSDSAGEHDEEFEEAVEFCAGGPSSLNEQRILKHWSSDKCFNNVSTSNK